MNNNDKKLKTVARLFARKEGESLLAEANELRQQNISYLTPRADKTVKGLLTRQRGPKQRNALFGICAAAACIAITIRIFSGIPGGSEPSRVTENMSDAPSAPPATAESPESSGPSDLFDLDEGTSPLWTDEILPITFTLPSDYEVTKEEFDNGMSIYRLESETRGDVVLTMHYEDSPAGGSGPEAWLGFDEVIIDGAVVPAKVQGSYMLLAFEQGGLRYTLSSKDDLGALTAFYRSIERNG